MSRGRVEGERALLRLLLQRRFGVLSPNTVERIGRASVRDLEAWAENVLDVDTARRSVRYQPLVGASPQILASLGEPVGQAL